MTFSNFTAERQEFDNLFYSFGIDYLNKMTQNGICRGTFIGVPGLQEAELGNFVSTLFCKFALANKPKLSVKEVEQKKKPLLLYITLKDDISGILRNMYQYLKTDQGIQLSMEQVSALDTETVSEYVMSRLTTTGFEIKFSQFNPSETTHLTLIDYFNKLESLNYSLHFTTLNHIYLLRNTELTKTPPGQDERATLRRVRNFCVDRGTIFISPFLLSDDAARLLDVLENKNHFIKKVSGGNYYDECRTVAQELDLEIYVHTFAEAKGKYLTVQRGKYRSPKLIEDKYLFFEGFDVNSLS